jgi:hypothetical protein
MRRSGHPSRPSAMTCCFFSSLKTFTRRRVTLSSQSCPGLSPFGRFSGNPHSPVLGDPRGPKGNRMMRRILSQIAWATIASKGSEGQRRYRKWVGRLCPEEAAWAAAHYQLRVIWNIRPSPTGDYRPRSAILAPPDQARNRRSEEARLHGNHHASTKSGCLTWAARVKEFETLRSEV